MKASNYHKRFVEKLVTIYPPEEANALMRWVWEDLIGLQPGLKAHTELTTEDREKLEDCLKRLMEGEPIQHILGYGYFYGRRFKVSPEVLVPRQETEELMVWIRDSHFVNTLGQNVVKVLDVGTGSGCIPISLGLEWKKKGGDAVLMGLDVSSSALDIALSNARLWEMNVQWVCKDIFRCQKDDFVDLDILVSNPPYIPEKEKAQLFFNVADRDPDIALFVPDNEALKFYQRIAERGLDWLKPGAYLYFEVHSDYGKAVAKMMESLGYVGVELKKDLNQRDRMLRGKKT